MLKMDQIWLKLSQKASENRLNVRVEKCILEQHRGISPARVKGTPHPPSLETIAHLSFHSILFAVTIIAVQYSNRMAGSQCACQIEGVNFSSAQGRRGKLVDD